VGSRSDLVYLVSARHFCTLFLAFYHSIIALKINRLLRDPILLNAHAIQAGLVESMCRAATAVVAAHQLESHDTDEQASLIADLPEVDSDVLLNVVFTLAYLAYEDRSSASVITSSIFNHNCALAVALVIIRGFSLTSPSSPRNSSIDTPSNASAAASTTSFAAHSTQLIVLLALLICYDPGISTVGFEHRNILNGNSVLSALQLLAGSWPFLQAQGKRWVAVAACLLLPLALSQSQTSFSIHDSSSITSPIRSFVHRKADKHVNSNVASVIDPVSGSPQMPMVSMDRQSMLSSRLLASDVSGLQELCIAGPKAAVSSASSSSSSPVTLLSPARRICHSRLLMKMELWALLMQINTHAFIRYLRTR
jgi:hypothetical protein